MISAVFVFALVGLLLLVALAEAEDRTHVDLFDAKGHRTGYAIVDRKGGRVDLYEANSNRTGWGRITPSGRIELFGLDGKRQEGTALPLVAPEKRK